MNMVMIDAVRYICLMGVVFGIVMAGIWIAILIVSIKQGPFQWPKPPEPPRVPDYD